MSTFIGLEITGNEAPLTVGGAKVLTCSSDLETTLSIEWLYSGEVVATSNSQRVDLLFNPVNTSIHNNVYTCRVTAPFGALEDSTVVTVIGKLYRIVPVFPLLHHVLLVQ